MSKQRPLRVRLAGEAGGVKRYVVEAVDDSRSADEDTAKVDVEGVEMHCHRCGVTERFFGKCQHVDAVRKEVMEE